MRDEYEAVVLNYRLGYKSQRARECLIKVLGVDASISRKLIGWKVGWPVDNPRIVGRISRHHGRTGTLRARFRKGLPGQAIGDRVKIIRNS
jgi:large subunit ribosomal protein L35Ae